MLTYYNTIKQRVDILVSQSEEYSQSNHSLVLFNCENCETAAVPLNLEEYRRIHDNRYDRNGDYNFIEWACRRVTTLTQLDCALRSEQLCRLRKSMDFDFESFKNNQYHDRCLPVGVVTYQKVKPRGGSNAEDPDETFRTFVCCTCDQRVGHSPLSPVVLDADGNLDATDTNSPAALSCLFNLWKIMLLAHDGK